VDAPAPDEAREVGPPALGAPHLDADPTGGHAAAADADAPLALRQTGRHVAQLIESVAPIGRPLSGRLRKRCAGR
jgi:hypothetical protein